MKISGWRVLTLNSDGTPLQIDAWEDIIHLPLEGLAFVHEWARDEDGNTVPLHGGGQRVVIELPSVIQVNQYVRRERRMSFNRHAIYARDDMTCQFCGDHLLNAELTIDHIVPRHMLGGDASTWGNCVTCCRDCNGKKGGRTLEEMKKLGIRTHNGRSFRLLKPPTRPAFLGFGTFLRGVNSRNLEWLHFIPEWRALCRVMEEKQWLEAEYDSKFPEGPPWSSDKKH